MPVGFSSEVWRTSGQHPSEFVRFSSPQMSFHDFRCRVFRPGRFRETWQPGGGMAFPLAATLEKLTFWTQNYGGLEYDDVFRDFNCWVTFWGEPAWIFFPREELRSNKFPVRITTTPGPLHVHSSDRHLRQKSTRPPPSNDHHYGQPTSRKRFRRSVLFHWSCWCLENLRPKKKNG